MTPLPEIPSNLKASLPTVPNLTPKLPQFPDIPEIPGVSQVRNLADELIDVNPLVKAAFPISVLRELVDKYKQLDGSVDFNTVTTEINAKVNVFVSASTLPSVELPEIPLLSQLENLIPTLPVIKVPTLADVEEYVSTIKEQLFIEQQQLVNATQLKNAQAELQPFSNRQSVENAIKSRVSQLSL